MGGLTLALILVGAATVSAWFVRLVDRLEGRHE